MEEIQDIVLLLIGLSKIIKNQQEEIPDIIIIIINGLDQHEENHHVAPTKSPTSAWTLVPEKAKWVIESVGTIPIVQNVGTRVLFLIDHSKTSNWLMWCTRKLMTSKRVSFSCCLQFPNDIFQDPILFSPSIMWMPQTKDTATGEIWESMQTAYPPIHQKKKNNAPKRGLYQRWFPYSEMTIAVGKH